MNPTFLHTEFNSKKFLDCIAIHFNFYQSLLVTCSLFAGLPRLFSHHCYDISLVSEARTTTSSLYTWKLIWKFNKNPYTYTYINIYIYICALSIILSFFFFWAKFNNSKSYFTGKISGFWKMRGHLQTDWLMSKKIEYLTRECVPSVSLFFF